MTTQGWIKDRQTSPHSQRSSRHTTKWSTTIICLLMNLLPLCDRAQAQRPERTINSVVAQHFDALGGLEAARKVQTLKMTGTIDADSSRIDSSYSLDWSRPVNLRIDVEAQGRKITGCYDEKMGWFTAPRHRVEREKFLPAITRTADFYELDALNATAQWMITPLLCHVEETCQLEILADSSNSHDLTVKATFPDETFDIIHIDEEALLVTNVERYLGSNVRVRGSFGSYRDVDGIQIAHNRLVRMATPPEESWTSAFEARVDDLWYGYHWINIKRAVTNQGVDRCRFSPQRVSSTKKEEVHTPSIKKFTKRLAQEYPAIDSEARVALQVRGPTEDLSWVHHGVGPIVLAYRETFVDGFSKALCTLFPDCHLSMNTVNPANFDLVFDLTYDADMAIAYYSLIAERSDGSTSQVVPQSTHITFSLSSSTFVSGHQVGRIDLFQTSYSARELKIGWSEESTARKKAQRAIGRVIEDTIRGIMDSISVRNHLVSINEMKQKPARLVTTAGFDDSDGLFPDHRLDAGERANIIAMITNSGPGPAFDVTLRVDADAKVIDVRTDMIVGNLKPGEQREVLVPITSSLQLRNQKLVFRIETLERRGYGAPTLQLEIQGAELRRPEIVITDVRLNDRMGRAQGDGDGRPANGETIEATISVENRGVGEAVGVHLELLNPKIEVLEPPSELPRIGTGEAGEAVMLLRIPPSYLADELSLHLVAADTRGAEVSEAEVRRSWPIRRKRPIIEVKHHLYDGTSPNSMGNRDGIASNGETLELGIIVSNSGDLVANNLRLMVELEDLGLAISPDRLDLGRLPPGTRAHEQRVSVAIPRRVGVASSLDHLNFKLHFEQDDFPAFEKTLNVNFEALTPSLRIDPSVPDAVARGSQSQMSILLWNLGTIDAEDVRLEIETLAAGIELYSSDRNIPSDHLSLNVGSVAVSDKPAHLRLMILARQDAPASAGPIRVLIHQSDFPTIEKVIDVTIEDRVATIKVEPQGRPSPPATTVRRDPSITFLDGRESGQPVYVESIDLRFEIQVPDGTDLRSVVLSHETTDGERQITIGSPIRIEPIGGAKVMIYQENLRLSLDHNHLIVTAITEDGGRGIRRLSLNRKAEAGRFWLAAIGVSHYQSIANLRHAHADAISIRNYYRDSIGIDDDHLFLLIDEQATLTNVRSLLGTRLRAKVGSTDTVVIYFSGHGVPEEDSQSLGGLARYLMPYDGQRDDLYTTALTMAEMTRLFDRLAAERIILILDTCFSGAAGTGGRTLADPERLFKNVADDSFLRNVAESGEGRLVLAASKAEQLAQEWDSLGHGVFTYYLLEGLRSRDSDLNSDGEIDFHELFTFVRSKVGDETGQMQNPVYAGQASGSVVLGRVQE